MREGERELRIFYQHRAGGFACDLYRARGKSIEVGGQIQVHHVQTFLQTFNEELGLTGFARIEPANVIGASNLPVWTGPHHRLNALNDLVGSDSREAERIVSGDIVVGAGDLVRTGRQNHLGPDVEHAQPGIGRRGILRENLDAEKLVQITDVPRNDHQSGNGRNLQG